MQPETELKLDLDADRARLFPDWPLLPAPLRIDSLHATYFDTPDRRLDAAGFSLRIRRIGRKRVQTVKANAAPAAGLFARDEWEMPVRGSTPLLDDRTPVAALLGDAAATLAPVFDVVVQRHVWHVVEGDATIELVLDQGEVRAGDRAMPVCEIELELQAGAPAALFAFARRIDADVAVRPGMLTKSERGHRLRDSLPPAYKAERIALDPDVALGEAFARIMANCLRHYRLNEALLLDAYHPDALHQVRVAVRRMRSALALFRPALDRDAAAPIVAELRWLAATLGEARDIDVLVATLDPGDPRRARLEAVQQEAHERVLAWLRSARLRALLLDLVEWLATGPLRPDQADRPAAPLAAARLRKLRRRVAKGGRRLERQTDEARHDVRKAAKKLRYGAEFFAGLFDRKRQQRRRKTFLAALERLQAQLGQLNDRASAPATLARYGLDPAPPAPDGAALVEAAADAQAMFADTRAFWR
ncbi:CYTH and CHAD domain-containing protein [Sphingobium sp.]|uniref:CYTH and CHAD domain-containing protein n=1 Tax=Sphingobium sp. TaxID=1912891 RepID=UPI002E21AE29